MSIEFSISTVYSRVSSCACGSGLCGGGGLGGLKLKGEESFVRLWETIMLIRY